MSLMGVDIGTTGCKAVTFSEEGCVISASYREYPTIRNKTGWAELDSRLVMDMVKEVIGEANHACKKDPLKALAFSSMGESMTPVSRNREILGGSILFADERGGQYVKRLHSDIGSREVFTINGNTPSCHYSMAKLIWIRDNKPEIFKNAWKFLLWGECAAFMLGGDPVTSYSLANRTMLFDLHARDWSLRLLDWAGLDREKLPECVPSGSPAGCISDETADELGLPRGVRIIVGGHDQCCNALGAGIHKPGEAVCGIGTVECITPVYQGIPEPDKMLSLGLNVEHHVLEGLYVSFIFNQSGILVKWFRDTFAKAEKEAGGENLYEILSREMPEEPTRLLVLPHFQSTGSPHHITDSAGVIAGLRTGSTRGDILKAIMEGATYYFMESLDSLESLGIDSKEFVATGGGAKSDAWLQIKADILGRPFVRLEITECGAVGCAILAGCAIGVYPSIPEGVKCFVRKSRTFEPDPRRHEIYRDKFEKYKKLYPGMKNLLRDL